MAGYRLTKKGRIAAWSLCAVIVLCLASGVSILNHYNAQQQNNSRIDLTQNNVASTTTQPPPILDNSQKQEVLDESWKKLKVNVFFKPDIASFESQYNEILDSFSKEALKQRDVKIQIEGNCATVLRRKINQKQINYIFSILRAQGVANYLKNKGIDPDRFIIVGNGSDKPLESNATPEGRKFNRRVDVFFKYE